MEEEQINKLKEIIEAEEKNYDFSDLVFNYIDIEELKEIDVDDLKDYLEDLNQDKEITNTEVINYTNAIEYLSENDCSLNESFELARELGFTLDNIDSEILASLLKSENNREDYREFIGDVASQMEEKPILKREFLKNGDLI